ncbi:MAG TPA: amino acid permease [Streptosporangiaceae bacterium]|nr:amino acid permease [Streptosporangiaceae bacterium]
MSVNDQTVPGALDDEKRLHELGYAQELRRRMSGFSNFAVSFTIISILSGCLTLYYFGMQLGGPAIIVWGWLIVGVMTLMVGLSMAEVCSSYPTAGGLYYWAAKLAPRRGPAWSWFTGWFNFLGQVAVTAGIDFGAALFINFLLSLWFNFSVTTHWHTTLIFACVLLVHGLLNQFGIRLVALLNDISVWWHIAGVLIIVGAVTFGLNTGAHAVSADGAHYVVQHASAKFVFTGLENLSGLNIGWWYILPIGLLMAQYTFTGYDASAHMTEETHNASTAGPRGIVMSILVSLIAGWVLLVGLTFAIQRANYVGEATAVVAPGQIWLDAIGRSGAELLLLVVIGAQLFCGMSSVTANSRMIYAFSRDGALPASNVWHRVNKRTRTPTNAIWLAAGGALILGLPYIWNTAAYAAVTSIATIGLYVAYVTPTYLRLRQGENFKRGPWHLGRWSYVVGWTAVVWVVIIFFLFMLPQFGPIGWKTFNYAVLAVAVVIGFAGIYWLVSARHWFKGPKVQGTPEELAAIEHELAT